MPKKWSKKVQQTRGILQASNIGALMGRVTKVEMAREVGEHLWKVWVVEGGSLSTPFALPHTQQLPATAVVLRSNVSIFYSFYYSLPFAPFLCVLLAGESKEKWEQYQLIRVGKREEIGEIKVGWHWQTSNKSAFWPEAQGATET